MEKNRFLTFVLGLIPGAGHMYLGLMKKGLLLMIFFGLSISVCDFLQLSLIGFIPPVIWFYCLFDTLTLAHFEHQDRLIDEEDFILKVKTFLQQDWRGFFTKYAFPIGIIALIVGIHTFFSNFVMPFIYHYSDYYPSFFRLFYKIPSSLFSVGCIVVGLYLLYRNKSKNN